MKKVTLILAAFLFSVVATFAEDDRDNGTDSHAVKFTISDFVMLDIEAPGNVEANAIVAGGIDLTVSAPLEAGEGLNFDKAKDESLWLNYSAIKASGKNKKISVSTDIDLIDKGLALYLTAGGGTGGKGTKGLNGSKLKLSQTAQPLITAIGSVYTGQGVNNGHQLTYELKEDATATNANYSDLLSGSYSVTVTYTIGDDN